jgi:putative PIN family toxin of toxin-antitoxin system
MRAESFSLSRPHGSFLAEIAEVVHPVHQLHVADDPDNRILECAIAGRADAIVTGDRAMLKLDR